MERQGNAQQKAGVADPVGDKDAGGVAHRDRAILKKRDQQVGAESGDFPADEGQYRIAARHQQRHRGGEQAENHEEAVETGFPVHVVHGEAGDEQAGQGGHHQQRQAQVVSEEIQVDPVVAADQPAAEGDLFGQLFRPAGRR